MAMSSRKQSKSHLSRLDPREGLLLQKCVATLSKEERLSFFAHQTGPGFVMRTVDQIDMARAMFDKGWFANDTDIASMRPVYLSQKAWFRFSLDEWDQIEEQRLQKERGEIGGSW